MCPSWLMHNTRCRHSKASMKVYLLGNLLEK
jgi:hypothetical protein